MMIECFSSSGQLFCILLLPCRYDIVILVVTYIPRPQFFFFFLLLLFFFPLCLAIMRMYYRFEMVLPFDICMCIHGTPNSLRRTSLFSLYRLLLCVFVVINGSNGAMHL